MKENNIKADKENQKKTVVTFDLKYHEKKKFHWKYFWGTIIILAIIFVVLQMVASKKLSEMSKEERGARIEKIVTNLQGKLPQLFNFISSLNMESLQLIKESIDKNIEKAYQPLYDQIESFSSFHYSVSGEYTELFTTVFGDVETLLQEKLFKPAKFDEKLSSAMEKIQYDSVEVVVQQFQKMKNGTQEKLDLNDDEIDFLFEKILKFTQKDMKHRFESGVAIGFKGMGIGAGVAGAIMMKKIISKKMATVIAKKIVAKTAVKMGSKMAGSAAGATIGATDGLLCGPGAFLCSPVGAIAGGVIGWFATDKIVVEVDQYFNEEDFKKEIRAMIDQQKQETKRNFYEIYTASFNNLKNNAIQSLEQLKDKKTIDVIQGGL